MLPIHVTLIELINYSLQIAGGIGSNYFELRTGNKNDERGTYARIEPTGASTTQRIGRLVSIDVFRLQEPETIVFGEGDRKTKKIPQE